MLNRCGKRREWEEWKWVKRGTEKKREETFHRTNFDLSLLAGRCCNKSQVVKGLDTSWHPLQKKPEVLPVSFRFGMEDGQVVVQLLPHASTSGWQHLGWNWDFASPEVFLWHLYEHSLLPIAEPTGALAVSLALNPETHTSDRPPLTPGSQTQSSGDGETLMWNIWTVFRFQVTVKGAAKWNLANLLGIHLERVVSSRGTNLHTLSTLWQWRPLMLLSYRWIYLAYTDLLVGLEVPPKVSNPLKFFLCCSSRKGNKIGEWCALFFKLWPVLPPPLSPSLHSGPGMETVLIVGSEQVQSRNREPENGT